MTKSTTSATCLLETNADSHISLDVLDKFMDICNKIQLILISNESYPLHQSNIGPPMLYCFSATFYISLETFLNKSEPTTIPNTLIPPSYENLFQFKKWLFPININKNHYIAIVIEFNTEVIRIFD